MVMRLDSDLKTSVVIVVGFDNKDVFVLAGTCADIVSCLLINLCISNISNAQIHRILKPLFSINLREVGIPIRFPNSIHIHSTSRPHFSNQTHIRKSRYHVVTETKALERDHA